MTGWMRWWFYRNISRTTTPRAQARTIELPFLLAAHLWCWVFATIDKGKTRGDDESHKTQQ